MEKRNKIVFLVGLFVFMLLLSNATNSFRVVNSAPAIQFIVENVFWGNPPNNVITVSPGDINVPLTIVIRNNSSETLRGVLGELSLPYPFTDYSTESNVSKASGQPVETGDVFNQTGDILPSGSFTLTFQLNIDDDAKKGVFYANLTIYYNIKQDSTFIPGEPQELRIAIRLPNRAPTIYSVNPTAGTLTVPVGQFVNFSCFARDPDDDNITYEWVFDGETVDYGQNYTYYARRSDIGSHTLTVEVSDGNLTTTNSWTIIVTLTPTTAITVSSNYLYGGSKNAVEINITNNVWVGRVQINLAVTQYLVIIGNSSWTINGIQPNDTISIDAIIFAPESLIGQTMQVSLSIAYSDNYGNTYTENYAIGFVIRGRIALKVYGIIVTPDPAKAGEKISVSGTILNIGNIKAMFTNVSILPNQVLNLDYESSSYIGDVDPNSPVPFTITAFVKPNVANGTYLIPLIIQYTDDLYNEHNVTLNVRVTIVNYQGGESNTNQSSTQNLPVNEGTIALVGTVIAIIAVVSVAYLRRRT